MCAGPGLGLGQFSGVLMMEGFWWALLMLVVLPGVARRGRFEGRRAAGGGNALRSASGRGPVQCHEALPVNRNDDDEP